MDAKICEEINSSYQTAAIDFFLAFACLPARDFFCMNLVHSYAEAIMAHHPESDRLDPFAVSCKVVKFVDDVFTSLERNRDLLENHAVFISELNEKRADFLELAQSHRNYRAFRKQEKRFDYLSRHFQGTSLLDIGCGSGELLNYISIHWPHRFLELIGIEIGDFLSNEAGFTLHVLDLNHDVVSKSIQAETGMILSALHHIDKDKEKIIRFLENVHYLGVKQLIVEEDVLVVPEDLELQIKGISMITALRQKQFKLRRYLDLSYKEQQAVTTMADYLSNVMFSAYDMPFPFAFQTLGGWQDIFNKAGWKVEEFEMLGFQQSNFNQVCQALFILTTR